MHAVRLRKVVTGEGSDSQGVVLKKRRGVAELLMYTNATDGGGGGWE